MHRVIFSSWIAANALFLVLVLGPRSEVFLFVALLLMSGYLGGKAAVEAVKAKD